MTLYRHEMKMNRKSLIIWTLSVGILCLGCILLYTSLEDSLKDMADAYSNMGAMSTALGMDKLSIATLVGFYATEVGMMFGLGGAMYAAILGTTLVSKEEAGHTAEFLNVFPVGRANIILQKYLALISNILIFNLVCVGLCLIGFVTMGEEIPGKEMLLYHSALLLMQIEIGTICFAISASVKKNLIGPGLGIAILAFAADLMCRIIPAIENLKYITPFYYANAADIFTTQSLDAPLILVGILITLAALAVSFLTYTRKDMAS